MWHICVSLHTEYIVFFLPVNLCCLAAKQAVLILKYNLLFYIQYNEHFQALVVTIFNAACVCTSRHRVSETLY